MEQMPFKVPVARQTLLLHFQRGLVLSAREARPGVLQGEGGERSFQITWSGPTRASAKRPIMTLADTSSHQGFAKSLRNHLGLSMSDVHAHAGIACSC